MKNVVKVLRERGLVDQVTSEDLERRVEEPISVYVGFDPTADSLHLGNLVGLIALAWFQKFGHTPVALLGGATGRIGDPSGKSTERPFLTLAELEANVRALEKFLRRLLHFSEGAQPIILNNDAWLGKLALVEFLRDIGKHFRIGSMLAKESVRARLQSEEGMSYTEFSYQVLQGYDFHYLNQEHGVTLQMGGSDQWGNITAGIELNRKLGGVPLYGLTFPLLTRSDGKKFGKTEEGAVWLSSERLSPYDFYQYLFRIPDADVILLLKRLTFLGLEEIAALEKSMRSPSYEPNTAQRRLAEEVTRFVHGDEGLAQALRVTEGLSPGASMELNSASLKRLAEEIPHATLTYQEIVGQKFTEVAVKAGLTLSKSEGVRLIQNGGAYCNNKRVESTSFSFEKSHLIDGIYLLLGAGKKKRVLIKVRG